MGTKIPGWQSEIGPDEGIGWESGRDGWDGITDTQFGG